ncbi:hypothetical protein QTP86_028741 [Hemibagrus guttatus]|nr:hypothetical protein QTP86_028741 [Hemibagrus guttatus]
MMRKDVTKNMDFLGRTARRTNLNVKVTNIIIGQQGIAAGVELPNRVEDWYQILEAAPHITLMIGRGFESKDIGPMMREAGQLRDWMPTLNPKVEISKDRMLPHFRRQRMAPIGPSSSLPGLAPPHSSSAEEIAGYTSLPPSLRGFSAQPG